MNEQEISRVVTEAAMLIHRAAGNRGMTARDYRAALAQELESRGLQTERKMIAPGNYGNIKVTRPEALDMIVGGKLLVEIKAESRTDPRWESLALGHLRMAGLKYAMVINFSEKTIRDGIRRVVDTGN